MCIRDRHTADDDGQQVWPVVHHQGGKTEQRACHQRQLRAKTGKYLGKNGNDEDVDDDNRHRHGDDDKARVAQRCLHLLAHVALELKVLEQPVKDLFEQAGRLANACLLYTSRCV